MLPGRIQTQPEKVLSVRNRRRRSSICGTSSGSWGQAWDERRAHLRHLLQPIFACSVKKKTCPRATQMSSRRAPVGCTAASPLLLWCHEKQQPDTTCCGSVTALLCAGCRGGSFQSPVLDLEFCRTSRFAATAHVLDGLDAFRCSPAPQTKLYRNRKPSSGSSIGRLPESSRPGAARAQVPERKPAYAVSEPASGPAKHP
jgi:hypothetical protein